MSTRGLTPEALARVDEARRVGKDVTFHVSKVKERRWNWILTMRYVAEDPVTRERTLHKVFLQTSQTRDPLEAMREYLETKVHNS
jgi:hypothetical protein